MAKKNLPQIQTLPCQLDGNGITVGQKLLLKCQVDPSLSGEILFVNGDAQKYEIVFLSKPEIKNGVLEQSVTSYKTGAHEIKNLTVKIGDRTFGVSPLQLTVQSVLPAKEQGQPEPTPFPNVDPHKLSVPWWWWTAWIVLFLALATMAFIKIKKYLDARRAAKDALSKTERVLSPREKFNLAMQKLESQEWHSKGEYKKFALELTAILKKSVGEKFRFPAEDQTTEEFFDNLSTKHILFWKEAQNILKTVFENLDQIKFAKVETTAENCLSLLDQSKKIGNILFRGDA